MRLYDRLGSWWTTDRDEQRRRVVSEATVRWGWLWSRCHRFYALDDFDSVIIGATAAFATTAFATTATTTAPRQGIQLAAQLVEKAVLDLRL